MAQIPFSTAKAPSETQPLMPQAATHPHQEKWLTEVEWIQLHPTLGWRNHRRNRIDQCSVLDATDRHQE